MFRRGEDECGIESHVMAAWPGRGTPRRARRRQGAGWGALLGAGRGGRSRSSRPRHHRHRQHRHRGRDSRRRGRAKKYFQVG